MNVIVTGSLSFDHIMNFPSRFADYIMPDKIHILNVSFYADVMRKEKGGTAGNISYSLGLLGFTPQIVCAAGDDFEEYRKYLQGVGVNTKFVKIFKNTLTAIGFCITDIDDNQIWGFSGGALIKNRMLSLKPYLKTESFVVIGPNDVAASIHFMSECHTLDCEYLFDPAFNIPKFSPDELRKGVEKAAIVIGNDYEVAILKKRAKLTSSDLLKDNRIVITTLGKEGSSIQQGKRLWRIPAAVPRKIIDPTGAGDAYRAGFLAGYLRGFPLDICGRMGSIAAVYTVEKYGTTTHRFTQKEFMNRYKRNYKEKLDLFI